MPGDWMPATFIKPGTGFFYDKIVRRTPGPDAGKTPDEKPRVKLIVKGLGLPIDFSTSAPRGWRCLPFPHRPLHQAQVADSRSM